MRQKLDGLVGLLVLKDQKLFCFNQKGYITLTGLGELFLKALENEVFITKNNLLQKDNLCLHVKIF